MSSLPEATFDDACPSLRSLCELLDKELPPDIQAKLENHLSTCEVCVKRLETLFRPIFASSTMTGVDQAQALEEATAKMPDHAEDEFVLRMKASFSREIPATIGPYQVLRLLGEGGSGDVFECTDNRLNRRVAVKTIRLQMVNHSLLERLKQEATIQAVLNHPNIVPLHDFGTGEDGIPYLVMPLVEGGTLAGLLSKQTLAPKVAADLVAQCARALEYAHQQGILHRDIKPSNILLSNPMKPVADHSRDSAAPGLVPKITDFGLAKIFDSQSYITHSGAILGTPAYMSPEQASGSIKQMGRESDVYALGVVLYESLTGRPPFRAESVASTLLLIQNSQPISPKYFLPGLSRDLETICLKCLEKEPSRRYPTSLALAEDLERFLAGRPIQARPVSLLQNAWRWCLRNRAVALSLGLAFVSLVAFSAVSAIFALTQSRLLDEAEKSRILARQETARALSNQRMVINQKAIVERAFIDGIKNRLQQFDKLVKLPEENLSQAVILETYYQNAEKLIETSKNLFEMVKDDPQQVELSIEVAHAIAEILIQIRQNEESDRWTEKVVQISLAMPASQKVKAETLESVIHSAHIDCSKWAVKRKDESAAVDLAAKVFLAWPYSRLSDPPTQKLIDLRTWLGKLAMNRYRAQGKNRQADAIAEDLSRTPILPEATRPPN